VISEKRGEMSNHLNVFDSYSQGGFRNIEREKVLENNVTRALIVTLHNSPPAAKYLLNRLFNIEFSDEFVYDLQKKLVISSDEAGVVKKWRRGLVLAIAPQKDEPRQDALLDNLEKKVAETAIKEKQKLQKLLGEFQQGEEGNSNRVRDIAKLLQSTPEIINNLNSSDLRYLYDLSGGSIPDAIIIAPRQHTAILVESKINGAIIGTQISRHVSVNFVGGLQPKYVIYGQQKPVVGEREVLVCICTWSDISSLLVSFQKDYESQNGPKAFLVGQFLEYLEDNNMGELKFKQQDFLDWERFDWNSDESWEHRHKMLLRLHNLGLTLAEDFGDKHWVNDQVPIRNYIGVNIVHNKYKERKPYEVPHWSLAIQQHGAEDRCLRLFIQCEGTKLTSSLLKNRDALEIGMTQALLDIGHPGISLRIEEKIFLAPGGKGRKENIWSQYFAFPLELSEKEYVKKVVSQALQAMVVLHDPERRRERLQKMFEAGSSRGKAIVGVLQLNFHLNWLELEKLDTKVYDKLKNVMEKVKPYYEVLLKYAD
jgi:hypothetical protein